MTGYPRLAAQRFQAVVYENSKNDQTNFLYADFRWMIWTTEIRVQRWYASWKRT